MPGSTEATAWLINENKGAGLSCITNSLFASVLYPQQPLLAIT